MSRGSSNGSRSSVTPVTVRVAAESSQSTPLGTASSSKIASYEIRQYLGEKLPVKRYLARIGQPNNQTKASTEAVKAPYGSTSVG